MAMRNRPGCPYLAKTRSFCDGCRLGASADSKHALWKLIPACRRFIDYRTRGNSRLSCATRQTSARTKLAPMPTIYGDTLDAAGRCTHYHSEKDVIANKCATCNKYWACYE